MDAARYRDAEQRFWASVGVAPTERRLHLRRSDVTVRVQEVGGGPPVLFVHGTTNSGTSWADLVARLRGFRCILVDRPGNGLSDPLPRVSTTLADLEDHADTLVVDVLDALDVDSAAVAATSFGGYFALRGAAAHPDRVRRLVVFGWTMGAPMTRVPLMMRVGALPGAQRLRPLVPAPSERMVRALLRRVGLRAALDSGRISPEFVTCYRALLRDTDSMRNDAALGRHAFTRRGLDPRVLLDDELLASIRSPAYFLWGEDDPFGDARTAREFVARLPSAELELLPGAGHAVWVDDPDHAATVTAAFLRR